MAAVMEVNMETMEAVSAAAISADMEKFKETFRIMTGETLYHMYREAFVYGNHTERNTDGMPGRTQPGDAQIQPARSRIDCSAGI
jgi:hypothetical protein